MLFLYISRKGIFGMRLSVKGEYACLALIDLSRNYDNGLVKIEQISIRQKIPQKYLEQILLLLKKAGYLRSKRGADGGYKLSRSPDQINVADVIRLIDGPLAPVESVSKFFYERTPIEKEPKLKNLLQEVRDYIAAKMEGTTFADLL